MAGNYTIRALADGQLPATKQTLYTAPASTSTIVKTLILVNSGSVTRTINVYVNVTGTSRRVSPKNYSLAPGAQVSLVDGSPLFLETGDLIEGDASAAAEIDYVIGGIQET